jgi:PIN domain nuclease of toxin-antitoxin system
MRLLIDTHALYWYVDCERETINQMGAHLLD